VPQDDPGLAVGRLPKRTGVATLLTSTTLLRRGRFAAVLAAGLLLAATFAGCTSSSDSEGTTTLATACREVDLAPVETAASDFHSAELVLVDAFGNEAALTAAMVAFLAKGSVFFTSMASSLDVFLDELARASNVRALSGKTDVWNETAGDFTALATDVSAAGTVTSDDIAVLLGVQAKFDPFLRAINPGSPSGNLLRRIPACKTLIRNIDAATSIISADDGEDEIRDVK
jgi:hypothetical protein